MALLNVASILAGVGRNVLMIDFDLEAPGLTLFQDRQLVMSDENKSESPPEDDDRPSRAQGGLIDALNEFLDDPDDSLLMSDDTGPFFDQFVTSLSVPEELQKIDLETGEQIGPGRLDLMPSGRLGPDYEKHMRKLDFRELFREGVGRPLFDRLRDVLRKDRRYDYILIDSRTGFSDEGNICTRVLPEYLVVLTGLNSQNVEGTGRFIERARLAERRHCVIFVASPVPAYYDTICNRRIQAAKSRFREAGLDNVRFAAHIPYHPLLALEEDPRVQDLTGTTLYDQYHNITNRIREWTNDQPESRLDEAMERLFEGRGDDETLDILREVGAEEPTLVVRSVNSVGSALLEANPENAYRVFDYACTLVNEEATPSTASDLLTFLGRAHGQNGRLKKAIEAHTRSLLLSESRESESGVSRDTFYLGRWHAEAGHLEKAVELYERARAIARDTENSGAEAETLLKIGQLFDLRKNEEDAVDHYKRALEVAQQINDASTKISILERLGEQFLKHDDLDYASDSYDQALKLAHTTGDQSVEQASVLTHLGDILFRRGDLFSACDRYGEALDIISEIGDRSMKASTLSSRGDTFFELEKFGEALQDYRKALDIARKIDDRSFEAYMQARTAVTQAVSSNDAEEKDKYINKALTETEKIEKPYMKSKMYVFIAQSIYEDESLRAFNMLDKNWKTISEYAGAFELMRAYVLRANLKIGESTAEDARTAAEFYRERGVDSRWSREAEDILEKLDA